MVIGASTLQPLFPDFGHGSPGPNAKRKIARDATFLVRVSRGFSAIESRHGLSLRTRHEVFLSALSFGENYDICGDPPK